MNEKVRQVLIPQYMKKFKCIGGACEDSCCIGWRVDIDHETYKKYQKLRDDEINPAKSKYISRNREAGHSEENYGKINLLENSNCPFLSDERLCRIQINHGEDLLSDVCTIYPRSANMINGVLERSASLSCPEAARLALINPDGIEFDEIEEPAHIKDLFKMRINTQNKNFLQKPHRYLWELRFFSVAIIQDRRYELWERMLILGLFIRNVQDAVDEGNTDLINPIIKKFNDLVGDGSFKTFLVNIPTQYNLQMELLKELADKRYFMGINCDRFMSCFTEFLIGIQYTTDAKVEEIGERYQSAYKHYYEPFMKEHMYLLENYIVNYIFRNTFPISGGKSLFNDYIMLVVHYSTIKMFLIGMSAFNKGLTTELVIKLIQSFAKTIEHCPQYLESVLALIDGNGYNTLPYMSILIKN